MPYEWTEPEVFQTFGEDVVYHCYHKGCVSTYHYQVQNDEGDWMAFDIRDLAAETTLGVGPDRMNHEVIVAMTTLGATLEKVLRQTEIWWEGEAE